jgi:hypothetical protein
MIYIIGIAKLPSPLILQIFFPKKSRFCILHAMEGQGPNFIDRAANIVEQMRNQALGLQPTTPGRQEQSAADDLLLAAAAAATPELQNVILDTIEDDIRLGATLEPLQDFRLPSAGPDSSGDEDARGHRRRNRITSREKKELMLLAANICHMELQARGRDKFWRSVVDKYEEQEEKSSGPLPSRSL